MVGSCGWDAEVAADVSRARPGHTGEVRELRNFDRRRQFLALSRRPRAVPQFGSPSSSIRFSIGHGVRTVVGRGRGGCNRCPTDLGNSARMVDISNIRAHKNGLGIRSIRGSSPDDDPGSTIRHTEKGGHGETPGELGVPGALALGSRSSLRGVRAVRAARRPRRRSSSSTELQSNSGATADRIATHQRRCHLDPDRARSPRTSTGSPPGSRPTSTCINAQGGVNGRKLVLAYNLDDGGQPEPVHPARPTP